MTVLGLIVFQKTSDRWSGWTTPTIWESLREMPRIGVCHGAAFDSPWEIGPASSIRQMRSTTGWSTSSVATHTAPCMVIRRRRWSPSTPASSSKRQRSDRQPTWCGGACRWSTHSDPQQHNQLVKFSDDTISSCLPATSTRGPSRSTTLRRGQVQTTWRWIELKRRRPSLLTQGGSVRLQHLRHCLE